MHKPNGRAISYIRFSTPDQIQGDSIIRQDRLAETFCNQHNLKLDSVKISDQGVSAFRGKNQKRGALGQFLKMVEDGLIQPGTSLIIEDMDRLTRQKSGNSIDLLRDLQRKGIWLGIVSENTLFSPDPTSMDWIRFILKIEISNGESVKKSDRIKSNYKSKLEKLKAGQKVHLHTYPFWLDQTGNKIDQPVYKIIPEKVAMVNSIFDLYLNGNSISGVFKIIRKSNKNISRNTIDHLLRDRRLIGELTLYDNTFVDYYPKIISDNDFALVQQKLKLNPTKQGRSGLHVNSLFPEIKCTCGCDVEYIRHTRGDTSYTYYRCGSTRIESVCTSSKGRMFKSLQLETWIFAKLLKILPTSIQPKSNSNLHIIESKLNDVKSKISKVIQLLDFIDDMSELTDKLIELKSEKDTLLNQIETEKSKTIYNQIQPHKITEFLLLIRQQLTDNDIRAKIKSNIHHIVRSIVVDFSSQSAEIELINGDILGELSE